MRSLERRTYRVSLRATIFAAPRSWIETAYPDSLTSTKSTAADTSRDG